MRFLLVDDEELILKVLSRELKAHELFLAKNYSQALEILLSEPSLDLVSSDCHMSGPDGVEVLRAALQHQPQARRVMHSGNPPANLGELIQQGLIHKFIPKPFIRSSTSLFDTLIND